MRRSTVAGPPTGVAVFGAETAIKSLGGPGRQDEHWKEYERGGHFAAMEVPELLDRRPPDLLPAAALTSPAGLGLMVQPGDGLKQSHSITADPTTIGIAQDHG